MRKVLSGIMAVGTCLCFNISGSAQPLNPETGSSPPCCRQDAISGWKHRQPTQAEVQERLREQSAPSQTSGSVNPAPDAGPDLGRTDSRSMTPGTPQRNAQSRR